MQFTKLDELWLRSKMPWAFQLVSSGVADSLDDAYALLAPSTLVGPNPFVSLRYTLRSLALAQVPKGEDVLEFLERNEETAKFHWLIDSRHLKLSSVEFSDPALQRNYGSDYNAVLHNLDRLDRLHPLFSFSVYEARSDAENSLDGMNRHEILRDYLHDGHTTNHHGTYLFDADWYLAMNDDVAAGVEMSGGIYESAFEHFMTFGISEGRSPLPDFEPQWYLQTYPDVAEAIERGECLSAIDHYLLHGAWTHQPHVGFAPHEYLDRYPAAADEIEDLGLFNPLEHFIALGIRRGWSGRAEAKNAPSTPAGLFRQRTTLRASYEIASARRGDLIATEPIGHSPDLSVIIPVVDNATFTFSLLSELRLHIGISSAEVEVVVVDNGSIDETLEIADIFDFVKVVRFEEPIGFPRAVNAGANAATGRNYLFLNNDIELLAPFFDKLVARLDEDPNLGAVGGLVLRPDMMLQEYGGKLFADGGTSPEGAGDDPVNYLGRPAREVDYVSGCLLGISRSTFELVEGFDEGFSPGYYEDVDMCVRLRGQGFAVESWPEMSIIHHEYGSFSKSRPASKSAALMKTNRKRLLDKHRPLVPETASSDGSVSGGSKRSTPRVALIEDFVADGRLGSGLPRTYAVAMSMVRLGCDVTVYALNKSRYDPDWTEGLPKPFRTEITDVGKIARALSEGTLDADVVWLSRLHNATRLSIHAERWRAFATGRSVVVDTEAVSAVRDVQMLWSDRLGSVEEIEHFYGSDECATAVEQELRTARVADLLIVVNELDSQLATAGLDVPNSVISHGVVSEPRSGISDSLRIGFLCPLHAYGTPNADAVAWLSNELAPRLQQVLPEATITVAGYVAPGVDLSRLVSNGVEHIGVVDSPQEFFRESRLALAPMRFGAGLPLKAISGMAMGTPMIVSELVGYQISGSVQDGLAGQGFVALPMDAATWTKEIESLWKDQETWQEMSSAGVQSVDREYSPQVLQEQVSSALQFVHSKNF